MGRKNGCREGVGEPQTEMAAGTGRNGWVGTLGDTVLLNGSNSLFFGIVPSILGECPPPH